MTDALTPAAEAARMPGVPGGGFDRFANAPVLPFSLGHEWLVQSRTVWWGNVGFLLLATLAVLIARWQLDFFDGAVVIFLSYLSDAVIFTWVFLGLQRQAEEPENTAMLAGWRALKGRWRAVLLSSLWGIPAAAASYAMFYFGPQLIEALVLAVGINLLGVATLLALILLAAYATFLLCLVPVMAGVHAARDAHAGFRVGGLWAYRGLRAGWRPLSVIFVVFITGCVVAGTVLTWAVGHLPVAWFVSGGDLMEALWYWYPWPGLLLAMNLFLALLLPMLSDLLKAADTDLSDEVFSAQHKEREGQQFVRIVLRRTAFAVRTAAAFCVLFGMLYSVVLGDMQQLLDWLGIAFALYLAGGGVYRWSDRWKPSVQTSTLAQETSGAGAGASANGSADASAVAATVPAPAAEPTVSTARRIVSVILQVFSVLLMLAGLATAWLGVEAMDDRSIAAFGVMASVMGVGVLVFGLLLFWGARVLGRPKKQTPPAKADGA